MSLFTKFEEDILHKFLDVNDAALAPLRKQLSVAQVAGRRMTGVGFYTDFLPPPDVPRMEGNPSFELHNVMAAVSGVQNGVGFVLFIREGQLAVLEGFTYDEPWPDQISHYELSYWSHCG